MVDEGPGLIVTPKDRPREGFEDPDRGDASWFTLFSRDLSPTERMCAGLMELEPGGVGLMPHRHDEPELYHVVGGSGIVTIGGIQTVVAEGSAAFIRVMPSTASATRAIRHCGSSTSFRPIDSRTWSTDFPIAEQGSIPSMAAALRPFATDVKDETVERCGHFQPEEQPRSSPRQRRLPKRSPPSWRLTRKSEAPASPHACAPGCRHLRSTAASPLDAFRNRSDCSPPYLAVRRIQPESTRLGRSMVMVDWPKAVT